MNKPKLLVAGNWKMNGLRGDLEQIESVKAGIGAACPVDVWVFPPATLLMAATALTSGSPLAIGGQDCRAESSGAFTGDLSAPMLRDAGASAVIAGHSERRSLHGETSREVRLKVSTALKAGLSAILCIGETRGERDAGLALDVCARQLRESLPNESEPETTIIAYEPVWAIGTGASPTPSDIASMHAPLRQALDKGNSSKTDRGWRILYGGSVTPSNAASILGCDEVDGVLVGGASLNAASFLAIIAAAEEALQRRKA